MCLYIFYTFNFALVFWIKSIKLNSKSFLHKGIGAEIIFQQLFRNEKIYFFKESNSIAIYLKPVKFLHKN